MAKLPGWMVLEKPWKGTLSPDGRSVVYNIRIRRWHPGLWWSLIKSWLGR